MQEGGFIEGDSKEGRLIEKGSYFNLKEGGLNREGDSSQLAHAQKNG